MQEFINSTVSKLYVGCKIRNFSIRINEHQKIFTKKKLSNHLILENYKFDNDFEILLTLRNYFKINTRSENLIKHKKVVTC